MPADWTWDGSVALSGSGFTGATAMVSGSTITVTKATVTSGAGGTITIQNLTAPNFDIESTFFVRSAAPGGTLTSIANHPSIVVGAGGTPSTPIADIQNDFGSFNGQIVTIQGIVTLGSGITAPDWTSAYVQDGSLCIFA